MRPNEHSNLLHSTKSKERIKVSDVLEYDSISEKADTLPVQSQHNDDAVSLGIKRLCKTIIYCMSLWALAYVIIMIQNITDSHFPLLLFFVPMWIGTIYGFVSITTIVKDVFRNGSTLVNEERRLFMQSEGISTAEYIDISSLPLLRKLLFSCFLGFISLILIVISQISFYVWFATGTVGFWYSILPMILLHLSLMGFCLISESFSYSACSIIYLSAVGMVTLIGKIECSGLYWSIVIIPLVMIECVLLSSIKDILIKQYNGVIRMNKRQILCSFCYILAILLAIMTNIVTVYNDIKNDNSEYKISKEHVYLVFLSTVAWIFIVLFFLGGLLAIFDQEMNELARSRGFTTPLELSRSEAGWVLDEIEEISMLLGTLKIWKLPHLPTSSIGNSYTKKLPRSLLTSGLGLSQLKVRKKNDIKYNKLQNNIGEYDPIDNGDTSEEIYNLNLDSSYENNDNSRIGENDNNNSNSILNKIKKYFIHKTSEKIDTVDMKSEDSLHMNDIEMNSTFEEKRKFAANAAELRRKYPPTSSDGLKIMNSLGVKNPYPKPDRDESDHPKGDKNLHPTTRYLEYIADDSEIHNIDESKSNSNINIINDDEMSTNYDYDKLSNSCDGLSNNYENISTSPIIGHVKIGSIMYGPVNYLKNMVSPYTNTNKSAHDMNSIEADDYVSTTDSTIDFSRDRPFKFNEQKSP